MWSDEQRRFVRDHNWDRSSREVLLDFLSLPPRDVVGAVRQQLSEAIEARDLELVDDILGVMWSFEIDMRSYLDLVARLFGENWHRHRIHEWLVRELQDMADPSTVPILRAAIALKPAIGWEGDFTSNRVFFKRCSHALRAIDTAESLALIEECSYSKNDALRHEALYRLLKIERGAAKPLANAGGGVGPEAAEREIHERLSDLVFAAAATRGVENLRLMHSLIVEACLLFSARCGYDVYSELLAIVEAPGASFADVAHRERWFASLYLFLSVNIRCPLKLPENWDDLQEDLPHDIRYMLHGAGAGATTVRDLFLRAGANVEQRALPLVYRQNAHVLNQGYIVADGIDQ